MPLPSTPPLMPNILGHNALINTDYVDIPSVTPDGDGIPSYASLFPSVDAMNPTAGGRMVRRSWFNGLFRLLGQHAFWHQTGAPIPWSASIDYPIGSHVTRNNVEYIATTTSGPNISGTGAVDPASATGGQHWTRNDIIPTGIIVPMPTNVAPTGFLPCNGAAVSRSTYSNLFTYLNSGTNPLPWGVGDGSTTFNVPNLMDCRYLAGSSVIGGERTYDTAGLPNITGTTVTVDDVYHSPGDLSGAFYKAGAASYAADSGGSDVACLVGFSAARSSSIYGGATTVRPLTAYMYFCIKY